MELQREEALSGMGDMPELPAQSQTAEGDRMMVDHHVKYKELHGVDETIEMTWSEHKRLHLRLRREGKCTVPVDEMQRISAAANERSSKRKAYKKAYHAEHKEQIKAYKKTYNAEHRDQINTRARARHAARKLEAMRDELE